MTIHKASLLSFLLLAGACPGPSGMDMEGIAVVPDDVIALATPGKRYALFSSYQRNGWQEPRATDAATVLCSDSIPRDIPFWAGFSEGCGAPGILILALREVESGAKDPCLSPIMGVRSDLKPLRGIVPTGSPLGAAMKQVFAGEAANCSEYGDDRHENVGVLTLTQ
jgi:hypothetical protein